MLRLGAVDERPRLFRIDVERDGDDFEPTGMPLRPQCLPPGQVEAASSPTRPRDE
jgi:hypothetical protein